MYCGYLYKLGQFLYKKRYFQYEKSTNSLCYYDNNELNYKRGSIEIKDILYFNLSKDKSYNQNSIYGFEITIPGKVYCFYATSEIDRIYWIEAITTLSSKLKQNYIDEKINDNLISSKTSSSQTTFSPQSPQLKFNNKDNDDYINYDNERKEDEKQLNNIIIKYLNLQIKLKNEEIQYNEVCNLEQSNIKSKLNQLLEARENNIELELKINLIFQTIKPELKLIKQFIHNSNSKEILAKMDDYGKLINILEELKEDYSGNGENFNTSPTVVNKEQIVYNLNILKEQIKLSIEKIESDKMDFITNCRILRTISIKVNKFASGNNFKAKQFTIVENGSLQDKIKLYNEVIEDIHIEINKIKELKSKQEQQSVLNKEDEDCLFKISEQINISYNSNLDILKNEIIYYIKQILLIKSQCKKLKQQPTPMPAFKRSNSSIDNLDSLVESIIKKQNDYYHVNNTNKEIFRCNSVGSNRSDNSLKSTFTTLTNSSNSITQLGKWIIPSNFKKISTGIYQFGTKRISATIQNSDSNSNLVIRVGGGYMSFIDFVYKYGERESIKLKSSTTI